MIMLVMGESNIAVFTFRRSVPITGTGLWRDQLWACSYPGGAHNWYQSLEGPVMGMLICEGGAHNWYRSLKGPVMGMLISGGVPITGTSL